MRRSEDFRRTVRHGVRAGRRTVVVHVLRAEPDGEASHLVDGTDVPAEQKSSAALVGFVVSGAIGSAVQRNRVRRRLRHLTVPHLSSLGHRTLVVVRALPPAAAAGTELGIDLDAAWAAAVHKLTSTARRDRR